MKFLLAATSCMQTLTTVIIWLSCVVVSEMDDGLCCRLTRACPKEPEPIPFKQLEVKRSEIQLSKKLGQGQFGEVWAGVHRTLVRPKTIVFGRTYVLGQMFYFFLSVREKMKMKMLRPQCEYVGKKEAGLQPAGVQDKEIQYHPLCSSRI